MPNNWVWMLVGVLAAIALLIWIFSNVNISS